MRKIKKIPISEIYKQDPVTLKFPPEYEIHREIDWLNSLRLHKKFLMREAASVKKILTTLEGRTGLRANGVINFRGITVTLSDFNTKKYIKEQKAKIREAEL